MESVYRRLKTVNFWQAHDWFERATKIEISISDFLALLNAGHCDVYVNCEKFQVVDKDIGLDIEVIDSLSKVMGSPHIYSGQDGDVWLSRFHIICNVYGAISEKDIVKDFCDDEVVYINGRFEPLFLSIDFEKLVQSIKNSSEKSTSDELNQLRKDLDDEKSRREFVELKVVSLEESISLITRDLIEANAELDGLRQRNFEESPSALLAIAGMLDLLLDDKRPRYNQTTIAEALEARGWRGTSVSGMTKLFAKANAAAKDAESETQAKAQALQSHISDKR